MKSYPLIKPRLSFQKPQMRNYSLFGYVNLSKYPRNQREAMSFQYEVWFNVATFPFFSSSLVRRILSVFLLRCMHMYIYFFPTLLFLSFLYVVQSGIFFFFYMYTLLTGETYHETTKIKIKRQERVQCTFRISYD